MIYLKNLFGILVIGFAIIWQICILLLFYEINLKINKEEKYYYFNAIICSSAIIKYFKYAKKHKKLYGESILRNICTTSYYSFLFVSLVFVIFLYIENYNI